MYQYLIYGLKTLSEIPIQDALCTDFKNNPDVTVKFNFITSDMLKCKSHERINKFNPDYMPYIFDDIAYCQVSEGCEIKVSLLNTYEPRYANQLILGRLFGFLLLQRSMISLHGSGIYLNHKGIILTGESRAGKSTTTSYLLQQGGVFLADDTCVLTETTPPQLLLAYPQRRLCRNVAIQFGYDISTLYQVTDDVEKYAIPVDNFMPNADCNALYSIEVSDQVNSVQINELTGFDKLNLLLNNIYSSSYFTLFKMPAEYLKKCTVVANQIRMFHVIRPTGINTTNQVVDTIQKSISAL